MAAFSEKLQEYISRSQIKIATLSKHSGVDRSFIQKMLSGERVPSDITVLNRLSDALMLTPSERRSLREAYGISRMGEDVYRRRLTVKRLLEEADSYYFHTPVSELSQAYAPSTLEEILPLQGKASVSDGLRMLLDRELHESDPHLFLVMQPDSEFTVILHNCCRAIPSLRMEHILRFDNEMQYQQENRYNLHCFHCLLPFLLSPCFYRAYFYYGNTGKEANRTSVFPWFVLGKHTLLSLSQDCERGILCSHPQTVSMFHRIFEDMQADCLPLFQNINTENTQFWNPDEWLSPHSSHSCSLQYEPCWGFFYSMDIVEKQLLKEIPNRETILEFFSQHRRQVTLVEGNTKCTAFFTMEGLEHFLSTGRLSELPDGLYHPLTLSQRLTLFQNMILCIQKGSFLPYVIRSQKFRIPRQISFFVADEQHLSCSFSHPTRGLVSAVLREKSIVYSVFDFLEYLSESDLVYSQEESEAILRRRLEEFAQSIKNDTQQEE